MIALSYAACHDGILFLNRYKTTSSCTFFVPSTGSLKTVPQLPWATFTQIFVAPRMQMWLGLGGRGGRPSWPAAWSHACKLPGSAHYHSNERNREWKRLTQGSSRKYERNLQARYKEFTSTINFCKEWPALYKKVRQTRGQHLSAIVYGLSRGDIMEAWWGEVRYAGKSHFGFVDIILFGDSDEYLHRMLQELYLK